MKKIFSSILVFALVLTISFSTFAASSFSDVTGHWAERAINRWSSENVVNGYADGTFRPDANITRAEFMAIITRIFEPTTLAGLGGYSDVPTTAWFYEAIAKGVAMGAIQGSGSLMKPNDNITRQDAILILDRLYHYETPADDLKMDFSDSDKVADWAYEAVLTFIDKGYVNGYEDRTLRPTAFITRAEVVKLLDNTIGKIITKSGTYDLEDVRGIVIVKANDVTLKNTDNVDKIFVLNDDVKDSLKRDGVDDKDVYVVSGLNKDTVKQTTGRTSSSVPTLVIDLYDDESTQMPKYRVETNNVTIKEGIKVTVRVNDEDTAIKNTVFNNAKLANFKNALASVISNSLDPERVLNTLDSDYSNVEKFYDWGRKTINEMKDDMTPEQLVTLAELKASGNYTLYQVYSALGLQPSDLEAAAIEVMKDYTFEEALSLFVKI